MDLQVGSPLIASGLYHWHLDVEATFFDGTTTVTVDRSVDGQSQEVVADHSPYGAGWGLASVSHLVVVPDGALMVFGSGDSRFFTARGNGEFTSPPEDFGTLTTICDGGYLYTFKNRTSGSTTPTAC